MSYPVTFDYCVGQDVTLKGAKLPGTVRAMLVGHGGVKEYKVAYYRNGDRVECWVYVDELEGRRS